MLIIRYKNAKPLHLALSPKDNKFYFANLILSSKIVDIIYFEDGIQTKNLSSKGQAYQLIGALERKNLPFILLIDKKCDIFEGGDLTIINADCLDYDILADHFEEIDAEKSTLFNFIFQEYLEFNQGQSFIKNFYNFVIDAEKDGLIKNGLLFVAVSSKDGGIYNNMSHGRSYDGERIRCFDETCSVNTVEEFSEIFESGRTIYEKDLGKYNEKELTEILQTYPQVFVDFVRYGCAKYNEEDYEDYMAEYYEEAQEAASIGMKLCVSCEDYFNPSEEKEITIEGKPAALCSPCYDSCYLGG